MDNSSRLSRRSALTGLTTIGALAGVAVPTASAGEHPTLLDLWCKFEAPVAPAENELDIAITDQNAYVLEITGNAAAPIYCEGDNLIVSPGAKIEPGNKVVIRMKDGSIAVRRYVGGTEGHVTLSKLQDEDVCKTVSRDEIDWMARIIWASQ